MSSPDAAQVLIDRLGHLTLGESIAYDRMVIFPVFPGGNGQPAPLAYRTLEQAIAEGSVKVAERASASVPELTLQNTSNTMVLIFDGEEIIGGQQNRVVNTTFLVAAQAKMDLPVSCVERGRWHSTSATFSSGESGYYKLRMAKHQQVTANLRAEGRPRADQGEIWAEVADREMTTGSLSSTGAMHEIYKTRDADLGAYQERFAYVPGALGLIVAFNGRVAGGDVFDQPGTAEALWHKLVRSYALDALEGEPGAAVGREQALEMLERVRNARCEIFPSLALGEDVRFEGEGVVGGGLVYEERPVHVNLFCTDGQEQEAVQRRARALRRAMESQEEASVEAPQRRHIRYSNVQQRVEPLREPEA